MTHWKVLTHDRRSPLQGGEPLWSGDLPVELPEVEVDQSETECAPGWNCATDLAVAFRIAGLWPDGRPSLPLAVEPHGVVVERVQKTRSSRMTVLREASEAEVEDAITRLSEPFGAHAADMAHEQMAWRRALARSRHDPDAVEHHLQCALAARGLVWHLRRFVDARDAWDAWAAWDAWDARDAWDAWAAWAAWAAWDAWDARDAWDAWVARAAGDAWDAWNARDARDALTWRYAALMGWVKGPADRLTVDIRDAYAAGLGLTLPTGPDELGWVMEEGR